MKISKETSSIIHHANDQDWEHIFFIVNPVTVILTKLIIEKFNLNRKNITIYSLRHTDISLIKGEHKHLKKSLFYRLLIKLGLTPVSQEVLKSINKKNKPFLLYCSWCFHESIATPSINRMLESNLSKGHFYIEEGQATYRPSKPFKVSKKVREIHSHAESFKQMYRDDSHGFISILEGAFPEAPVEKRLA